MLMCAPATTRMPRHIAEMCERLASGIIDKNPDIQTRMAMFNVERMDLIEAGVQGAIRAWPKFDASFGVQEQTYLHRPIECRMRDFLRKEDSRDRRHKQYLADEHGVVQSPELDQTDLVAFITHMYKVAKTLYVERRFNRGRRLHAAPQLAAIAALMKREGLSCRETARLFASRPDLRAVLRMKHLPSYKAIWSAAKLHEVLVTTPTENAETNG